MRVLRAAVRVAETGPRGFPPSAHAGPQMARWPLAWALGLLAAVAICECSVAEPNPPLMMSDDTLVQELLSLADLKNNSKWDRGELKGDIVTPAARAWGAGAGARAGIHAFNRARRPASSSLTAYS